MVLAFNSDGLFPWMTNNANFKSRLVINNVENLEVQVTLTAMRADGTSETVVRSIAPFGQLSEGTDTLFPTLGEGAGYSVLAESTSDLVRGAFVVNSQSGASGSSPAQGDVVDPSSASPILIFNLLPVGDGGASAPVVVNMGATDAEVVFYAFREGVEVTRTEPIVVGAGRPFAEVTANLFPNVTGDIYVVAESISPLAGMSFIFNSVGEPSMANASPLPAVPDLGGEPVQVQTYQGVAVTGFNRLFGTPIMDFDYGIGTAGAETLGAYNPDGGDALPLTPDMLDNDPYSVLLCAGYGLTPSQTDNFNVNVLLNDVPAIVGVSGLFFLRSAPTPHFESGQLDLTLAAPHDPVNLGKWMEANGTMYVRCMENNRSEISLDLKGLLPNRLYTVWAAYGGPPSEFTEIGLGGLPNSFSTDGAGNGEFSRLLNYCPYHLREGELGLLWLDIVFHSDHMVYGAIASPNPPAKDVHNHMMFFLEGTPVSAKAGK